MAKSHLALLIVNLTLILCFGVLYLSRMNFEFIIYVGVIIFFLGLIAISRTRINYTSGTLVGLTVWATLHLGGGAFFLGGTRLYDLILIPLSDTYPILRYDQLVHIWGFGASTLVAYCLLSKSLANTTDHPVSLGIVIIMAGLGVGAFNEIVEFTITLVVPESGVGGYINTSLDLCADLIGALLGLIYIHIRYRRRQPA